MDSITWKEAIIEALLQLGGIGSLDEILKQITSNHNIDFSNNKTPKKIISETLQINSFSTSYGVSNIFYSVYGVRSKQGVWGLVDCALDNIGVDMTPDDSEFPEGKKLFRQHIFRERNHILTKLAKENFKKLHGRLFCEICGFDFSKKYGDIGEDFIEVHHVKPISELEDGEKTKIDDLIMICSNCHSIIHRKRPWLTKDELKNLLL